SRIRDRQPPSVRRSRRSLKTRVAFTLAAFGGVVSLALATIIYLASQDLERRLIDDTLSAELDDYVVRRARNPHSLPERTATIRAFVIAPDGDSTQVPEAVAELRPGRHRLVLEGVPYRAAVRSVGRQRFAVLYDISALKRREQGFLLMLAGSVLLITLISALAGRWLAGRTIAPVTELVRRVSERHPEQEAPPPLAEQFPWHEVQRLAADFDNYLRRLHDFIERERLFTGDISHELRTPLAVIQGATDLLMADPDMDPKNRRRIARIDRAVAEMGEISGALLALAREQDAPAQQGTGCDVEAVAEELVSRHRQLLRDKPVTLSVTVIEPPRVAADHAVIAMVIGNLLRNALTFTDSGEVLIRLEADAVQVEDTGPGLPTSETRQLFRPYVRGDTSKGAGLGLSLVQRLCERQGWRVTLANRPGGGTIARVTFSAANGPVGETPPNASRNGPEASQELTQPVDRKEN
ncbi:MAG: HAMP domain-containing sensor histidine kinase, partial [Thiogranum sp.]